MLSDDIAEEIDAERRWEERGMGVSTVTCVRCNGSGTSGFPMWPNERCFLCRGNKIVRPDVADYYRKHGMIALSHSIPDWEATPQPASPMEGRTR